MATHASGNTSGSAVGWACSASPNATPATASHPDDAVECARHSAYSTASTSVAVTLGWAIHSDARLPKPGRASTIAQASPVRRSNASLPSWKASGNCMALAIAMAVTTAVSDPPSFIGIASA